MQEKAQFYTEHSAGAKAMTRKSRKAANPIVHPMNHPVVDNQRMTTPYRPQPGFERERRELEAVIKWHVQQRQEAARELLELAEEKQGEVVVRLKHIAGRLLRLTWERL